MKKTKKSDKDKVKTNDHNDKQEEDKCENTKE